MNGSVKTIIHSYNKLFYFSNGAIENSEKYNYGMQCSRVLMLYHGVLCNAWGRVTVVFWMNLQGHPSESITWCQWTGGGNKAVCCHRWGRVFDAVEVVGPAGGPSGVQSEAPSWPCLRVLSMINGTCLHVSTAHN